MVEHKMKKEYQSIYQRVHQTICGMIIPHIRAAQEEVMNQIPFKHSDIHKRFEFQARRREK
jgi:hypothetical protein